jgi:hypothetical protein
MAETDLTKTCTKCGESKPLKAFHTQPHGKYGVKGQCRTCANVVRRQREARRTLEEKSHAAKSSKRRYHQNYEQRQQSMRAWRQKNQDHLKQFDHNRRERQNLLARLRRARNPAKKRAAHKAWRESNKAYVKAANKAWRVAHPEQLKTNNKNWKQHNRDKVIVLHAKRRARQEALPATFTDEQAQFARQYFHYACAVCGNEEGFQWMIGFDHWIPIVATNCPGTVATNMIPLCHGLGGCNNRKHDKDPHAWLLEQFGTRKAAAILRKIETYFAIVSPS